MKSLIVSDDLLFAGLVTKKIKSLGYTAESVAVAISRALSSIICGSDLVVRLKDDQFCMMLQNTHFKACKTVAGKVVEKVGNMSLFMDDLEIHPSVSIEILDYPIDALTSDETLAITNRLTYK